MDKKTFNKLLKEANLSQVKFASILGIESTTVNCWGVGQNIPYWVESWLENYKKAKLGEDVIKAVSPFVKNANNNL